MMTEQQNQGFLGARRALSEFLIVLLGVMGALFAESWRQDRDEARSAEASIALLLEDLRTDSARLGGVLGFLPIRDTASAIILLETRRPEISPDSALTLLRRLLVASDYAPSRSTYESLLQNDGLRHLGSADLQARIVRYYQETQTDAVLWYDAHRTAYDDYALRVRFHSVPTPTTMAEVQGGWFQMPGEFARPWADVRADNELMSSIAAVRAYESNLQVRFQRAAVANTALRKALRELD